MPQRTLAVTSRVGGKPARLSGMLCGHTAAANRHRDANGAKPGHIGSGSCSRGISRSRQIAAPRAWCVAANV